MSGARASAVVYDLCLTARAGDPGSARWARRTLTRIGLRVRVAGVVDRSDERTSPAAIDASDSRLVVSLRGPADRASADVDAPFGTHPWITMLAPGCRLDPSAVREPGSSVVDLRDGLTRRQLRQLTSAIVCGASEADTDADPTRPLDAAALACASIASYDRIADQFADQWCAHPPVAPLQKLLAQLPRGAAVLDAGCGPGHHASYLADHGHDVIGVDLSTRMLEIARRRDRRITFERHDARRLPFAPSTFDAVWCAAMPMHVPSEHLLRFLCGLRRVVKPGGVVGINLPIGRESELLDLDADQRFCQGYRSAREVADALRRAGLLVVDQDVGQTTRATGGLDLRVTWLTVLARADGHRPKVGSDVRRSIVGSEGPSTWRPSST